MERYWNKWVVLILYLNYNSSHFRFKIDSLHKGGSGRMTAHYFIGIPLTEELQHSLSDWQAKLATHLNYKVWTTPEDFHITLKFLGASSDITISKIEKVMKAWEDLHAFQIKIGPAGFFGDVRQPRVLHAQVEKAPSLLKLNNNIEELTEAYGWQKNKRAYQPHVTLAKKNTGGRSPLLADDKDPVFENQYRMAVDRFHIYRVHPDKKRKYEKISTFFLDT